VYDIIERLKSTDSTDDNLATTADNSQNINPNSNDIALITDAGTPAVSDPGFLLVRAAIEAGVKVECLPGATAIIPALVQSGLPCDRFVFEGFLPRQKGRQTRLKQLAQETRTWAFYESPFRLAKTLRQLSETFEEASANKAEYAEKKAAVCREISKIHAETRRGTLKDLAEYYETNQPKGEIVVVIDGI
jgi:16S rRNA (cytidine1402-2'-O)-methyltransferase